MCAWCYKLCRMVWNTIKRIWEVSRSIYLAASWTLFKNPDYCILAFSLGVLTGPWCSTSGNFEGILNYPLTNNNVGNGFINTLKTGAFSLNVKKKNKSFMALLITPSTVSNGLTMLWKYFEGSKWAHTTIKSCFVSNDWSNSIECNQGDSYLYKWYFELGMSMKKLTVLLSYSAGLVNSGVLFP